MGIYGDDKENKYGNRDPISRCIARTERAIPNTDFARMIRGGSEAEAARSAKGGVSFYS